MMDEAQGSEVQGRSIIIDYTGEKSQMGARVSGKLKTFVWKKKKNYRLHVISSYFSYHNTPIFAF